MKSGEHTLKVKYSAPKGQRGIQLIVNGAKNDLRFAQTDSVSDWKVLQHNISLRKGNNLIEFKANGVTSNDILFDNIVLENK